MNEISILFSQARPSPAEVPEDSVVIWPIDRNWNDHGFGFQAKAIVNRKEHSTLFECALYVIPDNEKFTRFNFWLDAQWNTSGQTSGVRKISGKFFSIFKSEKNYREFAKFCRSDHGEIGRILFPMRDLVYLKWTRLESEGLSAFLNTERASKGVFRSQSTYMAWHRGTRILAGEPAMPLEDAKREFSFGATLPGYSGRHSLKVGFGVSEPLVDRCHALIGRNGAGKSQLLRELILQLGARIDEKSDTVFINGERSTLNDVELSPPEFSVNRVVAMSWDGRTRFPTDSRLDSSFQYFSFGMNDYSLDNADYEPTNFKASETQTSQLIQVLRDDESIANTTPFERLQRILRPALIVGKLCVYLMPTAEETTGRWIGIEKLQSAQEKYQLEMFARIDMAQDPQRLKGNSEPVPLSSGERMFLNFGIRGAARLTQGSLLIMDEPETHLHPNLVSSFMRVLTQLLEETRSIAIIATHSPFVVRELPGRCVHIVSIDKERRPSINAAYLRTLGASIDQLSVDIFGDAESDQLNQALARKIASKGLTFDEIRARYGRDLSSDMLSEIYELLNSPDGATVQDNE